MYMHFCVICGASVEHLRFKNRNTFPKTCSKSCMKELISQTKQSIDAEGLTSAMRGAIKGAKTMQQKDADGVTLAEKRARKANATMSANKTRAGSQKKRLLTMHANNTFDDIGEKIKQGMAKIGPDGLTRGQHGAKNAKIKARQTNEKTGRWIKHDDLPDFQRYKREVRKLTEMQQLSNIENFEKRGHVINDGYHLDHKFSIYDGFKNNVPPKNIANIKNLQFIHWRENIKKGNSSCISLVEVLTF